MTISTRTAAAVLLFLGLVVYFNALFNGFIIGDDEDQIIQHPYIRSIANIPRNFTGSTYFRAESNQAYGLYYRPLMQSVYAVLYSFFGADPLWFHLAQLVLHSINALFVFLLFRAVMRKPIALLLSIIFLVHPINSETVLHSANMQDVLFTLFGIAALLLLVTLQKISMRRYLLVGALLLLSLFSKESGLLFVLLTGVWMVLVAKDNVFKIALVGSTALGIYVVFRFMVAQIPLHATTISPFIRAPASARFLNLPKIVASYVIATVWPQRLSSSHFWLVEHVTVADFYLPLAIVGLVLVGAIYGYRRITNAKLRFWYIFFLIWLVIGIGMHSQLLVLLDDTLAFRWFYVPLVGVLGMVGIVLTSVRAQRLKLFWMSATIIVLLLSVRTVIRTFDWRNSWTLTVRDLAISPGNYFLENNLGTLFIRQKQYDQAKPYIVSSVARYPYMSNLNNMALILAHEGQFEKARQYFERSLVAGGGYGVYQNYINVLLYMMKDYKAVKQVSTTALEYYPEGPYLWIALAQAEYALGNTEAALTAARRALLLTDSALIVEVYSAITENREMNVEKYIEL